MHRPVYVQFGAGWSAPEGWLSFDSSPTVWLERLPLVGRFIRVNSRRFPADVRFGDILRGLPVPDGTVRAVYASHVLEHLSRDDVEIALRNTFKLLEPGGVFRLIVPDLNARAIRYLEASRAGRADAADAFMTETMLGRRSRPRGPAGFIRAALGNSDHLWMYDEAAMSELLRNAGFTDIRRCDLGDAEESAFQRIELADRFRDERIGCREVAMEARKPV
ncbi:class I SAM-dependent methyltransferase [Brevundimonas bacteroides]|uniref:class I SAM-dependent methyltransferase n=1 Tax=Brevundimonas bacteroides TaxID=74311 RepID=UPI00138DF608|nr:methyltransferase domain-containing protein [Brevundimonas bacteroides]